MAREHNFLLGQGERLVSKVRIGRGPGDKQPAYDLPTAKSRIADRLSRVDAQITQLPKDACPRGEAVAIVTLHPRFLSKSDYPAELFKEVGLRAVGSRARTIPPEKWGVEKHGEDAVTEDIFVAGAKSAFHRWATSVKKWTENTKGATSLGHIEDLAAFDAKTKLRGIPDGKGVLLEVVLHNSGGDDVVIAFIKYAQARGAEPLIARRRDVQGLTFLPVRVDPRHAEDIPCRVPGRAPCRGASPRPHPDQRRAVDRQGRVVGESRDLARGRPGASGRHPGPRCSGFAASCRPGTRRSASA